MVANANEPRFPLGKVVATPGHQRLEAVKEVPLELIRRHARGDWGEVCAEDARENDLSVESGFRILSAYTLSTGVKVWVITEADRSSTCILLPEEY